MPLRTRAGGGGTPLGQKPTAPKNTKAFFEAVAGKKSPLNRQSSRVAKPFDNTYLGDQTKVTAATPEQQAYLSVPGAKKGNQRDLKVLQGYVGASDTAKPLDRKKLGSLGGAIPGAATIGADPQVIIQRGSDMIRNGISLGSSASAFIRAVHKVGLPEEDKQQVIAGFAKDKALDQDPYSKGLLVAMAAANGNGIPAHATTEQLAHAAFGGHHHSLGDIINPINIAKDALGTPVFTAEGGFALGHATRAAIGGNFGELKAIGKSQLQQLEHPVLTAEKNPFQTFLQVAAPIKGVGKLAGAAKGLEVTPREVPIDAGLSSKVGAVIDRGDYSTNMVDRAFQMLSDKRVTSSPRLQSKLLKEDVRKTRNLETSRLAREAKPDELLMQTGAKGLSRARRSSLLANEGAGGTAREFEAHYNKLADHNQSVYEATGDKTKLKLAESQRAQAKIRGAQAERYGTLDNPTGDTMPHESQAFLDSHREAALHRTSTLLHEGVLDRTDALWRDYQHNIELRAGQGNERAIAVRQARNALDEVPGHKTPTGFKPDDPAQYELAHEHLGAALDHYIMNEDGIHAPFRVPLNQVKDGFLGKRFGGGKSLAPKTDFKQGISHLGHSSGDLFEGGNYTVRPEDFTQQVMEPHRALAGRRYAQTLLNRYGRPGKQGETTREGEVWVQKGNPKGGLRGTLNAAPALEDHAAQLENVRDDFKVALDDYAAAKPYPAGARPGSYVAMPVPVAEQVSKTLERTMPSTLHKVTRAYKKSVLYTRLAYPASNFVNSAAQSALGGVTAGAIRHRNAIELPDGLVGHGFMGAGFLPDEGRTPGLRGIKDEMAVAGNPYEKGDALLRGIQRTGAVVPNTVRKWSVGADDFWRKALYAQKAYADARKIAYPDESTISRFLRHRSIADEKIVDAYHQMARGTTPAAGRAAARAMKATQDFLGDFENMKRYDALDLALPFNSWLRFSGKLLLVTLPLKYPGRTALLYKISQLGQQGSAQQGVLPQYLQEGIPLGGSPTDAYAAHTQRANPFATLGTTFAPGLPGTNTEGIPGLSGLLGSVNPVLTVPGQALSGMDIEQGRQLMDENGNPIKDNPEAVVKYMVAQILGTQPYLTALAGGTSGKSDTSIPFLDEQSRHLAKVPLGGAQPSQPWWLPIINQMLPFNVGERNMTADQIKGYNALRAHLIHVQKTSGDPHAFDNPGSPAYNKAIAAATASANKLAAHLGFMTNPAATQRAIDEGTKGK